MQAVKQHVCLLPQVTAPLKCWLLHSVVGVSVGASVGAGVGAGAGADAGADAGASVGGGLPVAPETNEFVTNGANFGNAPLILTEFLSP